MPGDAKPFTPGVSGNPKGRPKGTLSAQIAKAARELSPEALERLKDWMRSDEYKASIPACVEILNRGYGRAPQEIIGLDGGVDAQRRAAFIARKIARMSDEEFDAFDRQLCEVAGDGDEGGIDPGADGSGEGAPGG